MIAIDKSCVGCGVCVDICPVTALRLGKTSVAINKNVCIECGICVKKCPVKAIKGKKIPERQIIRDIRFQVTRGCNFTCPWCFSDAARPMADELTLIESSRLVDTLVGCGLKTMTLTGGEPLLRKDFSLRLLRYLQQKKIYSKLFTNGSLLDEETIDALSGITQEVQVSLYDQDYWPKIRILLRHLKKQKIRTVLRATLTSKNYRQVNKIVDFAQACGADALRVRPFVAKGRGSGYRDYLMSAEAYKKSIGYLVSIRRAKRYPIQLLTPSFPFLYDPQIKPELFLGRGFIGYTLCKCIEYTGTILPNGGVRACGYFPQDLGNIRKENFEKIWSKQGKKKELMVKVLDQECRECAYITICGGGCRANAYLNSGRLSAQDPNCPKASRQSEN
ncbi:MAG: radical SAM protein [Candidatus Omnitrophota bacterium]